MYRVTKKKVEKFYTLIIIIYLFNEDEKRKHLENQKDGLGKEDLFIINQNYGKI